MKNKSFKIICLTPALALFAWTSCWAISFGKVAQNLTVSTKSIAELLHIICLVTGIALIAGSLMKYKRHRENPTEAPLSMVFVMLLTGLALIALMFIPIRF